MKIFISSVRKGLEEERDALGGLITALGHTPVKFEDFSAQSTPSREVCLRELASADVYLLLLGPCYGHVFPETGQSATHDEWQAARAAGMTRLVYRKADVRFEAAQQDFARITEAYATGVFRDSFHSTTELTTKVVQKVRELESEADLLTFDKLEHSPSLIWSLGDSDARSRAATHTPLLELHVLPLDFAGYSARELAQLETSLVDRVRRTRIVTSDIALTLSRSRDHVAVGVSTRRPSTWDTPQPGELVEVRLHKTGQISARASLPRDGLGSILDPENLSQQLTALLRFTGALDIIQQERVVVAAGVSDAGLTSIDTFHPYQSRTRVQLSAFTHSGLTLRTEPDESISLAALDSGADEVAGHLAHALITRHPSAT